MTNKNYISLVDIDRELCGIVLNLLKLQETSESLSYDEFNIIRDLRRELGSLALTLSEDLSRISCDDNDC